jgi:hypothetical protein
MVFDVGPEAFSDFILRELPSGSSTAERVQIPKRSCWVCGQPSLWHPSGQLSHLHVLGDSRVIIDWVNHKCNLSTVNIEGWKQKTMDLAKNIKDLSVHHIYRVHNKEADALSKRALSEIEGRLTVFHSDNGRESQPSCINIFEMPRVGEG